MIRAVRSSAGPTTYSLTYRGVLGLGALFGGGITMLVLVIVTLVGQHAQTSRIAALTRSNAQLLIGLRDEVHHEQLLAVEAKDAYCRLKHYESVSGRTVLAIAIHFHLLNKDAQVRWRHALGAVDAIPAATRCTGVPVGLVKHRTSRKGADNASRVLVRKQPDGSVGSRSRVLALPHRHNATPPRAASAPRAPVGAVPAPPSPPASPARPSAQTPSDKELPAAASHADHGHGPPGLAR